MQSLELNKPVGLAIILASLSLLLSCPAEPIAESSDSLQPLAGDQEGATTAPSVLDDGQVIGVDEAAQKAEQEINEENVMDALNDLEREING